MKNFLINFLYSQLIVSLITLMVGFIGFLIEYPFKEHPDDVLGAFISLEIIAIAFCVLLFTIEED